MEETAKERIKRKKKERKLAELEEERKKALEPQPPTPDPELPKKEEASEPSQDLPQDVEVLHIFPAKKHKQKWIAQGTLVVKFHSIGLEVKNVVYSILPSHDVRIQPPFKYYRFPNEPEKPDVYVECIKFDDKTIWKNAAKVMRAAVLEYHRDELPRVEESSQK